jgi:hypothetical protein
MPELTIAPRGEPIGYTLGGHDNDTYLLVKSEVCEGCGLISPEKRRDAISSDVRVKKRRMDVSATYDGFTIVSTKFKGWVESHYPDGVAFQPLLSDPTFYVLSVSREIAFDSARRKTRFLNFCPVCKQYEEVIGATPGYVKATPEPFSGLYRTDIAFGSGNSKHYLVIIDPKCYLECKQEHFAGAVFHPVYKS